MIRPARAARHGSIFVTAMWVIIIVGALLVVFARSMRVELIASGNRLSQVKADAVELGAEQYVLSLVDDTDGEAEYVLDQTGEAIPVGDGYFWLLRPASNEQTYEFGITDEAGKVNLTTAAEPQLLMLPGMTQEAADSILAWQDATGKVTGIGAGTNYYNTLPEPYKAKASQLETVEETLLVKGVTPDLLFGVDRNRNGVIDPSESSHSSGMANAYGVISNRGIFPYVTVYTMEANTDSLGQARVNVNTPPGATVVTTNGKGATPQAAPNRGGGPPDNPALRNALTQAGLPAARVNAVVSRAATSGPFANVFDFAKKVELAPQELRQVADRLTWTDQKMLTGLINVNTAPREVLLTLPGLQESDADALIAQRQRSDLTSIGWVAEALTTDKAALIGATITNRSYWYSADIVAVSGDGRGFKRVRIVVDARNTPAKIVYRKDLTSLGWPLPVEVRSALRSGQSPPRVGQAGGRQGFGVR